jgi:hypothetical protein
MDISDKYVAFGLYCQFGCNWFNTKGTNVQIQELFTELFNYIETNAIQNISHFLDRGVSEVCCQAKGRFASKLKYKCSIRR